jgi:hypothetical protein
MLIALSLIAATPLPADATPTPEKAAPAPEQDDADSAATAAGAPVYLRAAVAQGRRDDEQVRHLPKGQPGSDPFWMLYMSIVAAKRGL